MSTATKSTTPSYQCDRCAVAISYLPGHEPGGLPAGWSVADGGTHCLKCRRDLAAEAAFEAADAGVNREDRAKLRTTGKIHFEIERDPERTNGEIAKSLGCSAAAVLKARRRLEGASMN
jgi:hypothetical protein